MIIRCRLISPRQDVTTYFAETDYLGSIIGLMNPGGTYAEQFSFDAWGRRRNPTNWTFANVPAPTLTERGYTGHEHLDKFGLINMNGRMYDPVLGRFLSVDPIVQAPDNSQSLNGYSYCVNNPLKYTDPSGYSSRRFEYEKNMYANYEGTEFFNNYVEWWEDMINGLERGAWHFYVSTAFVKQFAPGTVTTSEVSQNKNSRGKNEVVIIASDFIRDEAGGFGYNLVYLGNMYYVASNRTKGLFEVIRLGPVPHEDPIGYFMSSWNPSDRAGGYFDDAMSGFSISFTGMQALTKLDFPAVSTGFSYAGYTVSAINITKMWLNKSGAKSAGDKARIGYNFGFMILSYPFPIAGMVTSVAESYGFFEFHYHSFDVHQSSGYWVYYNRYTGKWKSFKLKR